MTCELGLSLQSRTHFVALIFHKWFETVSVLRFLSETELLIVSLVHILSTSSSKSGLNVSAFYVFFLTSSSGFVDHFPGSRRETAEHRPSSGDHGRPLYSKKHGFASESVFKCDTFPIAHTSQPLDDDVVDMMIAMMMWLPWRQLAIDSEVSQLTSSDYTCIDMYIYI